MKKYMTRLVSLTLTLLCVFSCCALPAAALDEPDLQCQNAILVDATYGDILYDRGAYEKAYPASLTKLLTAIVMVENTTPETEFTLVNELNAFWEDRYSLAIKSENLSVALSAEDPKTGKKGSSCVRVYVIEGDRVRIDDLGKYLDTSAMTLWINP